MAIRSALSGYIINEEQDGFVTVDFDFINGHDEEDHHDLTAWEFVDQVDADVDDCSSIGETSDDAVEYAETIAGSDVESSPEYCENDDADSIGVNSDNVSENFSFAGSLVSEKIISPVYSDENIVDEDAKSVTESIMSPEYMSERIAGYGEKYSYEKEEDLEEDDYDLDDELVPYYVNGKLGRERMRKLRKRSCAKSKRSTYNYNKAGCLRGKHGLGLKHSLML